MANFLPDESDDEETEVNSVFNEMSEDVRDHYFQLNPGEDKDSTTKVDDFFVEQISLINPSELRELSCVQLAAYLGDFSKLLQIKNSGRDMNRINKSKNSALHYSILGNNIDCFQLLLSLPDTDLDQPNREGYTPFLLACKMGLSDCVKGLHSKRIDRMTRSKDGKGAIDLIEDDVMLDEFVRLQKSELEFFKLVCSESPEDLVKAVEWLQQFETLDCVSISNQEFILESVLRSQNEDFLENFVQKGLHVAKRFIKEPECFEREYLEQVHLSQQRENVFIELIQTEKVFYDDILILMNVVKKFVELAERELKDNTLKTTLKQILSGLVLMEQINRDFVQGLMPIMERRNDPLNVDRHVQIVKQFDKLKLDYYLLFIQNLRLFENYSKQGKHSAEVWAEVNKVLNRSIPYPRKKSVSGMMSRPRFRLVEYQNLVERILKYSSETSNVILFETATKCFDYIRAKLQKVNIKTDEFTKSSMIKELSTMFMQKFKINILTKNRQYIFHLDKIQIFRRKLLDNDCSLYVFNDSILFSYHPTGKSGETKKLAVFYFEKQKVCFHFHVGVLKILIHHVGSYMFETYMVFLEKQQNHMFYEQLLKIVVDGNGEKRFLLTSTEQQEYDDIKEFVQK